MGFLKSTLTAIVSAAVLTSCTAGSPQEPKTESTARHLTSESGYTLRVERGSGRVEVTSPEELCGVEFVFSDTESYLVSGEMKIPLSAEAAAAYRDYLVMAYPEDHGSTGEPQFECGGGTFEAEYRDGVPVAVSVTRGGVTREVTITEG